MKLNRLSIVSTLCVFGAWLGGGVARAEDDGDVIIGRTAAGQLRIGEFIPDEHIVPLPCASGLFQGWALNEPGFDHLVDPNGPADFFPLETGAQVRIVCLVIDPAFRAISPSFVIIDAPGESVLLGNQGLHLHLTWHINSADPAFYPNQTDWYATFKLIDTGSTDYVESSPFAFRVTNVNCLYGDINDDGVRDGRDIQSFVNILLDPGSAMDRQRCLADCNRDCGVTPMDVPAFVDTLLRA